MRRRRGRGSGEPICRGLEHLIVDVDWYATESGWNLPGEDGEGADGDFIAAARTAIPALLDALDERDRLLVSLRGVLRILATEKP